MFGFRRMAARASAVAALGMLAAAPGAAYAAPDDTPAEATGNRAELGGGSGIVLGSRTKCTLTTIGHDNAGRLVGFTAGHCAEAGTPVRGEQFPDVGVVGVVVSADEQLDYGVIEFDPNVVTPLRSVGGTTITGIGPSPAPWSVVCQNGRTTGNSCGVVWTSSPMAFMEQACSSYGDSGGPLTVGDRLVGLVSGPLINDTTAVRFSCSSPANPIHTPVIAIAFDTVRAAVDAGKGVGAGFQPI